MPSNKSTKTVSQAGPKADPLVQVSFMCPLSVWRAVRMESTERHTSNQTIWIDAVREYLRMANESAA